RGRVLSRELNVGLDAGHQPIARHPIVAALKAGDHAVEIVRGTGGEQRRARRIAERRIGLRFSCAVADVYAEIRAGPAPCGDDRRAVSRSLGRRLVDERYADAWKDIIAADGGIELVVDAGAHDVVGDVRTGGERD